MNKFFKKKWIVVLIVSSALLLGYGGYRLYNHVVEDITRRVRQSVSEGVSEGVFGALNPFKWPGKFFGRKKDKSK